MSYSKTSRKKWIAAYLRTYGRCAYCGLHLEDEAVTIDHMEPRARGGCSEHRNLVIACKSCNASKKDRTLDEFRLSSAAKRAELAVSFSLPQLQFLASLGLLSSLGISESHTFFFETMESARGAA